MGLGYPKPEHVALLFPVTALQPLERFVPAVKIWELLNILFENQRNREESSLFNGYRDPVGKKTERRLRVIGKVRSTKGRLQRKLHVSSWLGIDRC